MTCGQFAHHPLSALKESQSTRAKKRSARLRSAAADSCSAPIADGVRACQYQDPGLPLKNRRQPTLDIVHFSLFPQGAAEWASRRRFVGERAALHDRLNNLISDDFRKVAAAYDT